MADPGIATAGGGPNAPSQPVARLRDPLIEAVRVGTICFYVMVGVGVVVAAITGGITLDRLGVATGVGVAGYLAAIVAYVLATIVLRGRGQATSASAAVDVTVVGVALVVGFIVAALVGLTPTGRELALPLAILFVIGVLVLWAAMAIVLAVSALRDR
jgi:hypothetical protein